MLAYFRRELCLAKEAEVFAPTDDQPETSKRAMDGGVDEVIIEPDKVNTLETVCRVGIY